MNLKFCFGLSFSLLIIILGFSKSTMSAQPSYPDYRRGELIFKLTPESGKKLDEALKQRGASRGSTEIFKLKTGLPWLDQLNQRYHIIDILPLAVDHTPDEDLKKKYPLRSKRISPNTAGTTFHYFYLLKLNPELNLQIVIDDYSKHREVIYIHPNYIANVDILE